MGVRQLLVAFKSYRTGRAAGLEARRALDNGLAVLLPRSVARLVVNELGVFLALSRWVLRRTELAGGEFGYHERSVLGALVPLVLVASPAELLFVHLLAHAFSPWDWVKWALLALGIYAMLWLLGLYASLFTMPHRLEKTGLRVHYGVFAESLIPYPETKDTVRKSRKAPHARDGLQHDPGEDALYLATGGKTDVTPRLSTPQSVRGLFRTLGPATTVHLAADDPEGPVPELRRRVFPRAITTA